VARRFGRFAVLHAVLGGVTLLGVVWGLLAGTAADEPLGGGVGWLLLALVLAGLAVQVWFLVALAGVRELPWLREPDPAAAGA
jgi:hypothetical protein